MDNIYQRMLKITSAIETVAKNLNVGFGSNRYKAVGEADILRAVKPIEEQFGVYSYPYEREVIDSGTMERESKNGKTIQLYIRIKTTYRFVCIDKPESYIDIVSYGDGVDPQDKSPGKAMTYSDKYALMKAYKIQTGDDPDQSESYNQTNVQTSRLQQRRPARKDMEEFVKKNYDQENLAKMLQYFGVDSVEGLTQEQLDIAYAKKNKQSKQKDAEDVATSLFGS